VIGPGTQNGKWWFVLDEFLDRAERVLNSEIARRQDFATVGTTMRLIGSVVSGKAMFSIERDVPREADVESAAARVRPLFLENDPVFHGRVTMALGGLSKDSGSEQELATIKALKNAWQSFEKSYRWSMGTSFSRGIPPGQMRNDRQIARDFIYGDLVHADPEARARLRHISMDDRVLAAVVWVTDATCLTQATKQLAIDLDDAGSLAPRP